jgi:hypothetical protein
MDVALSIMDFMEAHLTWLTAKYLPLLLISGLFDRPRRNDQLSPWSETNCPHSDYPSFLVLRTDVNQFLLLFHEIVGSSVVADLNLWGKTQMPCPVTKHAPQYVVVVNQGCRKVVATKPKACVSPFEEANMLHSTHTR